MDWWSHVQPTTTTGAQYHGGTVWIHNDSDSDLQMCRQSPTSRPRVDSFTMSMGETLQLWSMRSRSLLLRYTSSMPSQLQETTAVYSAAHGPNDVMTCWSIRNNV
eukprot:m.83113 g.83113  ORF g.83113 m.83113 type:complete len:105 (-) comp9516_c1_seq1:164-478(-)